MRETVRDFLDFGQMGIVLVFLAGLVLGALLTNQVVDPILYNSQIADYNKLAQINSGLDKRSDTLYSCLLQNNIKPESCSVNPNPSTPENAAPGESQ